jgi:hypothetical protein
MLYNGWLPCREPVEIVVNSAVLVPHGICSRSGAPVPGPIGATAAVAAAVAAMPSDDASGSALTWHHAFGVQSSSGAVSYLDEDHLLYPVGRHIVINDPMDLKDKEGGSMQFIEVRGTICSLAVSHDGKHVAVVEAPKGENEGGGGEGDDDGDDDVDMGEGMGSMLGGIDSHNGTVPNSRVSVYRLDTRSCVKVLRLSELPEVSFAEIVSIAWTPDDRHLMLQAGMPSWTLCYWAWAGNSNKAVAYEAVEEAVTRVSVHPGNAERMVTTGPGLLREWTLRRKDASKDPRLLGVDFDATSGSRCPSFTLHSAEEFTDHCWLQPPMPTEATPESTAAAADSGAGVIERPEPMLLVGTSHGNLLIFARDADTERLVLQYVMADYWMDAHGQAAGVAQQQQQPPGGGSDEQESAEMIRRSITAALQLRGGFAVANAGGWVYVFEFAGAGQRFQRSFQLHKEKTSEAEARPFVLRNRLCCESALSLSTTPDVPLGALSLRSGSAGGTATADRARGGLNQTGAGEWGQSGTVWVRTMTANPENTALAAVFSDGQVASFPLGDIDLLPRDVSAGA